MERVGPNDLCGAQNSAGPYSLSLFVRTSLKLVLSEVFPDLDLSVFFCTTLHYVTLCYPPCLHLSNGITVGPFPAQPAIPDHYTPSVISVKHPQRPTGTLAPLCTLRDMFGCVLNAYRSIVRDPLLRNSHCHCEKACRFEKYSHSVSTALLSDSFVEVITQDHFDFDFHFTS